MVNILLFDSSFALCITEISLGAHSLQFVYPLFEIVNSRFLPKCIFLKGRGIPPIVVRVRCPLRVRGGGIAFSK